MFGQNPLHSGVSPDTAIDARNASTLTQTMAKKAPGGTQASPIVAYNATLAKTVVYEAHAGGLVIAYDVATGKVVWQLKTAQATNSTPAYYGNTLYFGNHAGQLYEVNATTGAVDCIYQLPVFAPLPVPGRIQSSPVVGTFSPTGPIVYFEDSGYGTPSESENAGHAWAVTGQGNTMGACQLVWDFNGWANKGKNGTQTGAWSEPALVQDSLGTWLMVFGTSNPDDAVYALDAATGTEV
jgi:outer membrane protein assembly factor BamB